MVIIKLKKTKEEQDDDDDSFYQYSEEYIEAYILTHIYCLYINRRKRMGNMYL